MILGIACALPTALHEHQFTMSKAEEDKFIIEEVRSAFRDIGYDDGSLRNDYSFANYSPESSSMSAIVEQIELAAFAQSQFSLRSACFGVTFAGQEDAAHVQKYRALGAAQILTLHRGDNTFRRWLLRSAAPPELKDKQPLNTIGSVIRSNQSIWNPQSVLRAKTIAFAPDTLQPDFADAGLITALESELRPKLSRLLQNALTVGQAAYQEHHKGDMLPGTIAALYRLVFRLLAAKLQIDRGDRPEWANLDVGNLLRDVETVYPDLSNPQAVLQDQRTQQVVWQAFNNGLLLQNLSIETLAYVYEHTLVRPDVRERQAIHATPPEVAEFMVRRLPLDRLKEQEQYIFEPFCGHAPFLIAAMGRMRELPLSFQTSLEWHEHFKRMLSGIEQETLAREIAVQSLILADYSNPNGWRVIEADVFDDPRFEELLNNASAVFCNPPYGTWATLKRSRPSADALDYAEAEALRRTLQHPPMILGFVLPRTVLERKETAELRKTLAKTYSDISVIALPDTIFNVSRATVVLLLAHNLSPSSNRYFFARVGSKDKQAFLRSGTFTESHETDTLQPEDSSDYVLWQTPRQSIWNSLAMLPPLSQSATLEDGIRYNHAPSLHISKLPQAGYATGVPEVKQFIEPYVVQDTRFLLLDAGEIKGDTLELAWDAPKVLLNRARVSIDIWCLAAVAETTGLYATRQLYGVWPKGDLPVAVLAAILNGPVANAFVFDQRAGIDNYPALLKRIPVPNLKEEQTDLIVSLVDDYRSCREWMQMEPERSAALQPRCRDLLLQIDAAVLEAYGLTAEQEALLLQVFEGVRRPLLPFDLTGYGNNYARAKQAVANKRHWNTLVTRYHALVDKEFESGLTASEEVEQEQLSQEIDAQEARDNETILAGVPTGLK